ncbi:EVE domain-containing protein [Kovacikia minuta CCNUW1]|uniref:EVE domain-containing protein n=1 Tax=Kovacikia minuta TaxID=2931930 RepID=UPI001CC8FEF4|nr:EVE domain-containing protein [Kovacikia minuta]UBF27635.1 EVE domain-containing protein [Kovacikia minuta CCNUW1]
MAYWLFQANPKYSRILDGIGELEGMHWLVTRYAKEIAVDDGVLIWVAGAHAGIYAIAQVTHATRFVDKPPDLDYWILPMRAIGRFYAPVRFTHKLLEQPILKALLRHDPVLRGLQVIRTPHSTNFRVLPQEWDRVQVLLGLGEGTKSKRILPSMRLNG